MVNVVTRNNTILDHYYCNRPEKLSTIKTEFKGGSDHKLIIATRYSKVKVNGQRYITKRCFKYLNRDMFISKVEGFTP